MYCHVLTFWLISNLIWIAHKFKILMTSTLGFSLVPHPLSSGEKFAHNWGTEYFSMHLEPRGHALPLEGGTGMCRRQNPLFHASQRSLAYKFTLNAPFMCPPPRFLNFWENFAYSALFWAKISALKTQNFWIFAPQTTHFSRKTRSP